MKTKLIILVIISLTLGFQGVSIIVTNNMIMGNRSQELKYNPLTNEE